MVKNFCRREKKYLLNEEQCSSLICAISDKMDVDSYCTDGKPYMVYSMYYDSSENAIMYHCSTRPDFKEKLRVRSYSRPQNGDDTVFVEMKRKICGIGSKRRIILTYGEAKKLIQDGELPLCRDYYTNQVAAEINEFCRKYSLEPYVRIHYERIAFFDRNNRDIRLTIDKNIIATQMRTGKKEPLLPEGMYLLEIKFFDAIPLYITKILSEQHVHMQNFSKCGKQFEKDLVHLQNYS